MKKVKHLALSLIGATLVTASLFSCSSDEINHQPESKELNSNVQGKPATTSDEGYTYALSFYSGDISLGRSVDLIDPDTNEGVTVTEVTAYGDSRARGYIINKLENNDFLYFADVNRSSNVLTIFKKATSGTRIFNNLTESPDYLVTNKFDIIEFSNEYLNATYGSGCGWWKRFMGSCIVGGTRDTDLDGNCVEYDVKQEYLFGWKIGEPYVDTMSGQPCAD